MTYLELRIQTKNQLENLIEIFGLDVVINSVTDDYYSQLFDPYWAQIKKKYSWHTIYRLLKYSTITIPKEDLYEYFERFTQSEDVDDHSYDIKRLVKYCVRKNIKPKYLVEYLTKNQDHYLYSGNSKKTLLGEEIEHFFGFVRATLTPESFNRTHSTVFKYNWSCKASTEKRNDLQLIFSSLATEQKIGDYKQYEFVSRGLFEEVKVKILSEYDKFINTRNKVLKKLLDKEING